VFISVFFQSCRVPNCEMMREVWVHIKQCSLGPSCPHPHCLSSLRIIAHWKSCLDLECPVCKLVRIKGAQSLQRDRHLLRDPPTLTIQINPSSSLQQFHRGQSSDE